MRGERVALVAGFGGTGSCSLALGEVRGRDELAVDGIDTRAAVALLDRLIDTGRGSAATLCAGDRDALFVALHRSLWGDRITATLCCAACGEKFDMSFMLSVLQAHLAAQRPADAVAPQVPRATDEIEAAALGPEAGVARLAERLGIAAVDLDEVSDAMQAHFPLLDLELDTPCPECGHGQTGHFDLQSFLLLRLIGERPQLYAEIHALASGYGWSLREILALPRGTRRALANTIGRPQTAAAWSAA